MADTSAQLGSFPEGQSATFQVNAVFGQGGELIGGTGEVFVAVLLHQPPTPPPGVEPGLHISSLKLGDSPSFNVVRSFASGYLILGATDGTTFFATRVAGAR
jgi:hypothetical protein